MTATERTTKRLEQKKKRFELVQKELSSIEWYNLGVEHGKLAERLSQLEKKVLKDEILMNSIDNLEQLRKDIKKIDEGDEKKRSVGVLY